MYHLEGKDGFTLITFMHRVSQTGCVLVWRHQVVRKLIGNNVDLPLLLYQLIFRVKSLNQ